MSVCSYACLHPHTTEQMVCLYAPMHVCTQGCISSHLLSYTILKLDQSLGKYFELVSPFYYAFIIPYELNCIVKTTSQFISSLYTWQITASTLCTQ